MLTPGLGRSACGALGRTIVTRAPGTDGCAASSASCRVLRNTAVTVAIARWLLINPSSREQLRRKRKTTGRRVHDHDGPGPCVEEVGHAVRLARGARPGAG